MSNNKSILITGGAGFIGSNLCEYFLAKEYKIVCLDNFSTGHKHNIEPFFQNENFQFIEGDINPFNQPSGIRFKTDTPKAELYQLLQQHLADVQPQRYQLQNSRLGNNSKALLQRLSQIKGQSAAILPELTMIMLQPENGKDAELFTLVRNSAHFNVNSLFAEENNRNPTQDNMTLVHGLLGSYPNAFWRVKEADLAKLVAQAEQISSEQDYARLLDNFGIRRSNPNFWAFSDKLNQQFMQNHPVDSGWLDYNRLENR